MGSSKSSAEPTRQSINAGMVIVGLVLLATAVDQTAGLQLLWFALPVVVMVVGGAKVSQQWRQFRHWRAQQVVISEQRLAMRAGHLEQAAQERALAIIESKGHGLDFQARAIRHAQIGIWVVHIATQQITFEGIHIGSREFVPEVRVYQARDWYTRLHPHERDQVEQRFSEFVKRRIPDYEMEYRETDGRGGWRWVLSRGLITESDAQGRSVVASGTHTDIHQRKLAQIAHDQERALFHAGPVVIFRHALEGDRLIDFISRNAAQLWRYRDPVWTAEGKSIAEFVHPEDFLGLRRALDNALRDGRPGVDHQWRVLGGDGGYRWHSMRVLFETDRGRLYARGYLIDIEDPKRLEDVAVQRNQALEGLVRQLHVARADSLALQESSDLLNSAEDLEEAFEIVRRAADVVFPGWSGSLYAMMNHGALCLVGQWGRPPAQEPEFQHKDCWGLRRGKPHSYLSAERHLRCHHVNPPHDGGILNPYICVPMSANSETVGALQLFANDAVSFVGLADIEVRAQRFSETLKLAMSNLRLRAWLKDQATRDGLTGLYNRRLMDERLPIEIKRSHRDQLPVSLALLDADHFKRFNDEYGHEAGDLVLKSISDLLLERVRVYDLACRYGGEELVLVMPGCLLDDAASKMESLREEIARMQLRYQGQMLPPVTVSIGLASTNGGTAESLLRHADEALYAAKRQGRNCLMAQAADKPTHGELH